MYARLTIAAAGLLLFAACATPAAGPRVANNPCDDPQYRALKAQPVDSLSQREYQALQEGDAACAEITRILASSSGAAPRREERIDTDAYTQAMRNDEGSEIYVRNLSSVPIIVTSVTLTSCVNLADPCNTQYVRVRIPIGDARRVLRVRYRVGGISSRFLYSYQVEPVTETTRN
jgi:hypothetical protein